MSRTDGLSPIALERGGVSLLCIYKYQNKQNAVIKACRVVITSSGGGGDAGVDVDVGVVVVVVVIVVILQYRKKG